MIILDCQNGKMKGVWYEEFGDAGQVLNYGDLDKPTPANDEVLIRLKTSGVNPSDVKKRAGSDPDGLKDGPVIPHSDGAGIIIDAGSTINNHRIGERVWVYNGQFKRRLGTCAEYISIPGNCAVHLPENTSFETGACLGIPVMTAHRCVYADGPVQGKNILVTGGAGRVAHYAIQMCKMNGARVIATAGSEASARECLKAGADQVVAHPDEDTSGEIHELLGGEKLDRIIEGEFGGNLNYLLDCLKTGGTIAAYASMMNPNPSIPFYKMMYLDLQVRLVIVYDMPEQAKRDAIKDISDYLENKRLRHRISARYPLRDVVQAHLKIEQPDTRGCVIVRI